MKKMQGVLRDEQLNVYRIEAFRTKREFLFLTEILFDFTKADEEAYPHPLETEEEVNEFLKMYGYSFTPLSDEALEMFEDIAYNSYTVDDRLTEEGTSLVDYMLVTDYKSVPNI